MNTYTDAEMREIFLEANDHGYTIVGEESCRVTAQESDTTPPAPLGTYEPINDEDGNSDDNYLGDGVYATLNRF